MERDRASQQAVLEEIAVRASTPPERWGQSDKKQVREVLDEVGVQDRIEHLYNIVEATNEEQKQQLLVRYHLDQSQLAPFLSSPLRLADPQPSWIEALDHVVGREESGSSHDRCIFANDPLPFQEVLLPFLWEARHQYYQQLPLTLSLLEEQVQVTLEHWLLCQLSQLAGRALLLEFSQFRQQHVFWDISSERRELYEEFVAQYRGEGLLTFFREYSTLARLLILKMEQWVNILVEFVQRLAADREELEKTFNSEQALGLVVKIQPGCSDVHHQGRSVFLITFAAGVTVVYKPRCLSIDQAFVNLLLWVNTHGLSPSLKPLQVVSRATYGWMEYITHKPCNSQQEVQKYYQRAGILLGLLYVLGGMDIHNENLIAHGEYPVLVDLETVIYPGFPPHLQYQNTWENSFLQNDLLSPRHSVLEIGLLPSLRWGEKINLAYDGSGLGGVKAHTQLKTGKKWKYINTDAMHQEVVEYTGKMSSNTVLLHNMTINPLHYDEDVTKGFCKAYHFLITHRRELLAADGPLTAFVTCPLRFVRRGTQIYGDALLDLTHPAFLREGTDHWIELQVFVTSLFEEHSDPMLWKIAESEIFALQLLDIPWFGTYAESRDLWLETGEILPDIFPQSAMEQAKDCLLSFDEAELARQSQYIRTAFLLAGSKQGRVQEDFPPFEEELENHETLSTTDLVEASLQIAHHLCAYATDDPLMQKNGTWVGLLYNETTKGFWQGPVGFNLYRGASGIALFLAALEKVTGEHTFHDLIISTIDPLCQRLKNAATSLKSSPVTDWSIGGTSGLGAWMYALSRIGTWLDEPQLLEAARSAAYLLTEQQVQVDRSFDVISGSAGALLGVLSLYAYQPQDELLERAVWCGQHLLAHRVETDGGIRAWPAFQAHPLTGLSHGAAGIAYSLLRLAEATRDPVWKDAAEEALIFEQAEFLPDLRNWRDLRKPLDDADTSAICMTSWCHGAPGIGLARLGGLVALDTPHIRTDLAIALQTTQDTGLQEVDSLCCGNFGNIELLVAASQRLQQPQFQQVAMQWSSVLVHRARERDGFHLLAQLPRRAYTPGLFQGSAGVGYELLRVAFPERIPSVLLWE